MITPDWPGLPKLPAFRATLVREHDGDSFWMLIDNWFGSRQEEELRLAGVPAPEVDQVGGTEATLFVNTWLAEVTLNNAGRRWPFGVLTTTTQRKLEPTQLRTHNRYLAYVYDVATGDCLNEAIMDYLALHPEWPPGKAPS